MRVQVRDIRLFLEVYGQEWRLAEEGPRRRPVLLGLHGGPGADGAKARYQLSRLADVAQVVVPDQRGHGRSDLSSAAFWNLATWAADVKGLCDALGVEHPIVFGGSFGGFVAQRYAADFPGHAAGLILSSTSPRLADVDELAERFRDTGGDEAAEVLRRDWEAPSEETSAQWRRVCGPLLSLSGGSDPQALAIGAARIQTPEVGLHYFEHEGKSIDLRDALAEVRCPTLVLVGERDPLTPERLAREIVSAIPEGLARLEVIPSASHDLLADNPADAYRCIREFIVELGS